ncbi:MAG TPA: sortase [Candidatus Dojkabacteria bacterium]|nr:sortase [Candidatus Dojkabacteria bacterium]
MKNFKKITITLLLILLVLSPAFFLVLYPNYNNLVLAFNSLDFYNISKEASVKILTQISPNREKYHEQVLGATSIEESLKGAEINLERKVLEELNTTIRIDTINIEGEIVQGESSLRMNDGFWHFPTSSLPGEKGNSVIIGHRFLHLPPRKDTFFNLEDIKIGENIIISQNTDPNRPEEEEHLNYIVTETKIVEPNDLSVIQQADDYRLTLITCTPLWTSEKRFVVIAKLDKLYKKV